MTGLGWTQIERRTKCPKCNKVQMKIWYDLFNGTGDNKCISCGTILTTKNIKKNKKKLK